MDNIEIEYEDLDQDTIDEDHGYEGFSTNRNEMKKMTPNYSLMMKEKKEKVKIELLGLIR